MSRRFDFCPSHQLSWLRGVYGGAQSKIHPPWSQDNASQQQKGLGDHLKFDFSLILVYNIYTIKKKKSRSKSMVDGNIWGVVAGGSSPLFSTKKNGAIVELANTLVLQIRDSGFKPP